MPPEANVGGLLDVGEVAYEEIGLSSDLGWLKDNIVTFYRGGIYLLAGQPGIGKSTLGIQIALDLGRSGIRTLFVLTEQSKADLKNRAVRMSSAWPTSVSKRAMQHILPHDEVYDIETLPSFLAHQVMSPGGHYYGIKTIIIDSIQGYGLPSTATSKYRQLYEFCRQCKFAGITVLLVAHVTKSGNIAGPKDMEHNVDCVLVMRKAMSFRPIFVPKNRFGPAVLKPIPLMMEKKTTALQLAPHSQVVSTVARTFIGGQDSGPLPEVQAAVSLPSYGMRGKITAPGLPRKEIEQLANCISQLPDMDVSDLDYTIHCRLPGERRYRSTLGLPLAMGLISSYIQKDIPAHHVYIGEIDLLRKVREVPEEVAMSLLDAVNSDTFRKPVRLFLPKGDCAALIRGGVKGGVTVVACERLEDAVYNTWPELKQSGA